MTGHNDRAEYDVSAAAGELLETWNRLASSHTMIGASCSCGAHGIVLRLSDFEQDIGDYLHNEAEQHQRRDVLFLLQEKARAGERWSIVDLLQSMAEAAAVPNGAAARFVLERLPRTVHSFEELHRRR